jgi:succinoglycan biosynthesis transport protein ExoP
MDAEQTTPSLEQVLGVLRRRSPWILLCFVLVAAAAFGFSHHQKKKYTATASLVFSSNEQSQEIAGFQSVNSGETPAVQQDTNVKLVQLGDMAAKTAGLLGQGLTKDGVATSLSVSPEGESNIVNVAATASSPALAAGIANTYTSLFVKEQQNSNHAYYASALAQVNKQLAALSPRQRAETAGLALEGRAQSLGTLAELRNGNVQVAQAATAPSAPSSPKTTRNVVLGAFLGLLLGLAVAFSLERFDRRIREPQDLEAIYALPLLGIVPESAALSRSAKGKGKNAGQTLPASETEAFHLIRAHLRYFNVDRELRMLLVASAAPGDGKTTVARHLAGAAARMGSRALLLEADLRRPTVAQQLDVRSGPGVSDVLIGAAALSQATQTIELDQPSANGREARTLDVLVAGAVLPPNPGELIESHAMEALLEQVSSTYDLVVIDTPPLTAVSDAFPLLRKVDGVIIVGRVGRNRRDVAERLHQTLVGAGAPLLGVVANGFKSGRRGSYGYAYDYTMTDAEHPAPPPAASTNGASRSGASAAEPVPSIKA